MGDPAGIGAEIAVKALAHKELYEKCVPVVIGDVLPLQDAIAFTHSNLKLNVIEDVSRAKGEAGEIDVINLNYLAPGSRKYGNVSAICGEASFNYITRAIELVMQKKAHAVVTGPINKESVNLAGHHYSGHTEIFAHYTNTGEYGMMLATPKLRVIHVTTHVSLRDACDIIRSSPRKIVRTIELANDAMRQMGFESPKIAVAGLNAHCSENGLFGDEEKVSIIPAINECRLKGIDVYGPVPPDTVFVKAMAGIYDIVVVMYHDQGHIPIKLSGFSIGPSGDFTSVAGVNVTVGLPIIRTSVDHGTAYDIAGQGRADEGSLIDAINVAVQMAQKRFPL